jgi:hypothetical protein
MKNNLPFAVVMMIAIAGFLSFTSPQSSITGKVTPAEGATTVWAVQGTDSVKATISAGAFAFQVRPGTYRLLVDARDPYKDVSLENLEVKEGQPLDVGEIVLQQ